MSEFPISGKDYPTTWDQFVDWFATEQDCLTFLQCLRWSQGFRCPQCGSQGSPYEGSRNRMICGDCKRQTTATAGTIFDKTRTPLRTWFAAAWYLTSQKHGVSALGLQRVLGFSSYQTAWTMLHRFRRAMVRPDRERLKGYVEVDETYVAITQHHQPESQEERRSNTTDVLVAVAVEIVDPKGFGRIRLQRVHSTAKKDLLPFVLNSVETGSTVRTDGQTGYNSLSKHGYIHDVRVVTGAAEPAHVIMPAVHRVASLLKRWLLGTHHGAIQPSQLDYYLDEFSFRFNRRAAKSRGLLFYRLLQQSVLTQPVTYRQITSSPKGETLVELSG